MRSEQRSGLERTDLTVRPATADDADALAQLFTQAREAAYPAMPRPVHDAASVRTWFAELLVDRADGSRPTRETWLAERDDVVGYLVLDDVWLDSLYVHPDHTGQGIGSALLDLAKVLRPGGFSLYVFESNLPAQAFYARHGLVTVRRTDASDNEERAPDLELAWPPPR